MLQNIVINSLILLTMVMINYISYSKTFESQSYENQGSLTPTFLTLYPIIHSAG